jgi:hypothetical protein
MVAGAAIASGTSGRTLAPTGVGTAWPPLLCARAATLIEQSSATAAGMIIVFFILIPSENRFEQTSSPPWPQLLGASRVIDAVAIVPAAAIMAFGIKH